MPHSVYRKEANAGRNERVSPNADGLAVQWVMRLTTKIAAAKTTLPTTSTAKLPQNRRRAQVGQSFQGQEHSQETHQEPSQAGSSNSGRVSGSKSCTK